MSSAIAREYNRPLPSYQPPQPRPSQDCGQGQSLALAISLNFQSPQVEEQPQPKPESGKAGKHGKHGKHGKNGKAGKHGKAGKNDEQSGEEQYSSPLHDGSLNLALANSQAMSPMAAPQDQLLGLLFQLLQMASAPSVCNVGANSGLGGFLGGFDRGCF